MTLPTLHAFALAAIAAASAAASAADQPADDLLRFSNGDQLHGHFAGLGADGRIAWQRPDLSTEPAFDPAKVRQVVLRGGRPARGIDAPAAVRVVGGDRLPCSITGLDERALVIDTPYAGRLTIPRNRVDTLSPQPFGGAVRYSGPFTPDGWRIVEPPAASQPPAAALESKDAAPEKTPPPPPWVFSRTAWYSGGEQTAHPLVLDQAMGDSAVLRFHAAWRDTGQVGLSVAFHADFAEPPPQPEDNDAKANRVRHINGPLALPWQFGNCYVLTINPHYSMIYRCGFDEQGKPFTFRMDNAPNSSQQPLAGEAEIEIRSDRLQQRILLFINGEFRMQWDESQNPWAGKGAGIGFLADNGGRFRISELLVTDWNGMPDSARSMETPDRDVVLLANGTDRFSGRVLAIADAQVTVEGSYATMHIPLARVAEIHFARNHLAQLPESTPQQWIAHLHPLGRIAGKPLRSDPDRLVLDSPHLGEVAIQLDFASLLELQTATSFVDDWDTPF